MFWYQKLAPCGARLSIWEAEQKPAVMTSELRRRLCCRGQKAEKHLGLIGGSSAQTRTSGQNDDSHRASDCASRTSFHAFPLSFVHSDSDKICHQPQTANCHLLISVQSCVICCVLYKQYEFRVLNYCCKPEHDLTLTQTSHWCNGTRCLVHMAEVL